MEIKLTDNFGPHTKYYPTLIDPAFQAESVLVTADDDILYPPWWLSRLLRAYDSAPDLIHCHRAHRIGVGEGERFQPYNTWAPCVGRRISNKNFATGVSGVLYPPVMLRALKAAATGFRDRAPSADDIWINFVAHQAGIPVRQAGVFARHFPFVPGSQASGLYVTNVAEAQNDVQIARTYGPRLLRN
ncbi:hypothetical protein [Agromyces allii]|uniref:Glycosyl transferase family 2 n=1 Tax=Agromyces allii TaxID=393607 RepID=A0ABN2R273_9MICO|nr:hypothetical protein [Agromyces allii]